MTDDDVIIDPAIYSESPKIQPTIIVMVIEKWKNDPFRTKLKGTRKGIDVVELDNVRFVITLRREESGKIAVLHCKRAQRAHP